MDIGLDSLFPCRRSMVHYDMVTVYLTDSLNSMGAPGESGGCPLHVRLSTVYRCHNVIKVLIKGN
jgi:hypothetical protein